MSERIPVVVLAIMCLMAAAQAQTPMAYAVSGDAIVQSLTSKKGNAERGRAIVADRTLGLCLLCHAAPIAEERLQGNLGPSLAGAGVRLSEGQLRLRIVDPAKVNPDSIMPAYYRVDGLQHVARSFHGKPILSADQIEDVVAWLTTLGETPR